MQPGSTGGSTGAFPRWSAAQRVGHDELDPTPLLLPGPDETPSAYLARLKALHGRLGALITTIEQRREARDEPPPRRAPLPQPPAAMAPPPAPAAPRPPLPTQRVAPPPAPMLRPPLEVPPQPPVSWPEQERRAGIERRIGAVTRRHGLGDRRHGTADAREIRTERRAGPRERRTGAADRRRGIERRRRVKSLPWEGRGPRMNTTTLVWVLQVLAWVTIAVVALVYGLGHS